MPHIILFENAFLCGNHKHVVAAEPDLAAADDFAFNDKTQSFLILEGNWQFFADINFATPYPSPSHGAPPVFGPGAYASSAAVGVTANTLSSLKPVTAAPTLQGDSVPALVTLFEFPGFRGDHRHIVVNTPDFTAAALPPFHHETASMAVQSRILGTPVIQLYSQANYASPFAKAVGPGVFASLPPFGMASDAASSLKLTSRQPGVNPPLNGDQGFGEIILFQFPSFHGQHKHIYQAEPDLGSSVDSSFLHLTQSMWVGYGAWTLFTGANFLGLTPAWAMSGFPATQAALTLTQFNGETIDATAPELFPPGAYASFLGTGIATSAIRSLRLPQPDIYFVAFDATDPAPLVWVVVIAPRADPFDLKVSCDGTDVTSQLTKYQTYVDASGYVWAQGYYFSQVLSRGQTHTVTATATMDGPSGNSLRTNSAQFFTPAPTPPPQTKVPHLVGLLESAAISKLTAANLKLGVVLNFTQTIVTDLLVVTAQTVAPNTEVPEGTAVGLTVSMTGAKGGIGVVECLNRTTDGVEVEVWTWNGSQWQDQGSVEYNNTQPFEVQLNGAPTLTLAAFGPGEAPPNSQPRGSQVFNGGGSAIGTFTMD